MGCGRGAPPNGWKLEVGAVGDCALQREHGWRRLRWDSGAADDYQADALDTREATATVVAVAKGSPNPQAVLCRRTDFVHMVCLLQAAAGT